MPPTIRLAMGGVVLTAIVAISQHAAAAHVTWTVDSSQSWVRLNMPDQSVVVSGWSVTVRTRNQNSTTSWSDAGGRRAPIAGTFQTELTGGSITFLASGSTLSAVEDKSLAPNPADWDSGTETYTGLNPGPAAFGMRLQVLSLAPPGPITLYTNSISGVEYEISSGTLPIVGGTFGSGSTFNFSSALFAAYGETLDMLGEPLVLPDLLLDTPLSAGYNSGGGTITPLGGGYFELVYNVTTPFSITYDVGLETPITLNGSTTGQIVATAFVPEPHSVGLATVAAAAVCLMLRRRR